MWGNERIKILHSLLHRLITLVRKEVLHCVGLGRLLVPGDEPQDLDVDLADVAGSVCQADDFHRSLGKQLLYLEVLHHPCVKVVNEVEL